MSLFYQLYYHEGRKRGRSQISDTGIEQGQKTEIMAKKKSKIQYAGVGQREKLINILKGEGWVMGRTE